MMERHRTFWECGSLPALYLPRMEQRLTYPLWLDESWFTRILGQEFQGLKILPDGT